MGLLSPAMKALLRSTRPEILPVLELALPDRPRRYASVAFGASDGPYEPKVKRWGVVRRAISLDRCGLELGETTVEIIDADRELSRLLASRHLGRVRNSPAVIRLASPRLPRNGWFTVFRGAIDRWSQSDRLTVTFTLRAGSPALGRFFPAFAVTEQDYPEADPQAVGQYLPLLYGRHNSAGVTGTGFVPTLRVGPRAYLVCLGRARQVLAVYRDGSVVTDYQVSHPVRGGKSVTEVVFNADQGDAAVTVDAEGYESVGDGSGDLVVNPAHQLRHLLSNFVLATYQRGPWLPASPFLDGPSFEATADFLAASRLQGARHLAGEQRRGLDVLEEWCDSFFVKPFLTPEGRLAVRPLDHRKTTPFLDDPWLREEDISGFEPITDPLSLVRRISAQYLLGSVDGKYFRTLEVADLSVPAEEGTRNLQMPWVGAEA